jgi:UDP-N-acetylglucosamine 2-epimerase (non-hydrolysing)
MANDRSGLPAGRARVRLRNAHDAMDAASPTVVVVAGTRPEAIKLAPIIWQLRAQRSLRTVVINSGQHAAGVAQTLGEFGVASDIELPSLPAFPELADASEHLGAELRAVFVRLRPQLVIIQGDTLTAYAGARIAHAAGYPVAHVEAGLRTDNPRDPFPEEWFRREISRYATLHFSPCRSATANLLAEGIPPHAIHQVGNTGIDSLAWVLAGLKSAPADRAVAPDGLVLVTLHRRENYDQNAVIVCDALTELANARPDLRFVFPVHPNPRVADPVRKRLHGLASCALVAPMSYRTFIAHATKASLIVSDSGGIQEEAPHLGTPLLVPRRNTERPEGIATGFVQLVQVEQRTIVNAALSMLARHERPAMPIDSHAPFGGGDAAPKIVTAIAEHLLERVPA